MNKEDAIKYFMETLYKKNTKALLDKRKIKMLEEFYKNNYKMPEEEIDIDNLDMKKIIAFYKEHIKVEEDFKKFLEKNKEIKPLLEKSKSALAEVKKQFKQQKALQPGIISECYYTSTIAKIFGLNKFVDLETCLFNEVPPECIDYINSNTLTFNCARYLYYNKSNLDVFIIQYGNPAEGDAEIIVNGEKIRLEFKETKAKAGEYDIKYDEEGKLILSEEFTQRLPELAELIKKFNKETNIIDLVGNSYHNFDKEQERLHVKRYFEMGKIDILISTNSQNQMLAVTPDCLRSDLEKEIISTKDSEIRTAGRNPKCIFTPNYFEQVMNEIGAEKIEEDSYRILKSKFSLTKGRGKKEITRLKLNPLFFIKIKDLQEEGDYYIIKKDKIKQLIPTISIHIEVVASVDELKEFYNIN